MGFLSENMLWKFWFIAVQSSRGFKSARPYSLSMAWAHVISFGSLKKGSLEATLYNMFGGSVIPLSHLSRITLPQNKHKLFPQGGLEGLGTFPPTPDPISFPH